MEDTPKEAKLHEGSASSVRLPSQVSNAFLRRYPKRGDGYFSSPPTHAGNLYALPFHGQDEIIIPHYVGENKEEFETSGLRKIDQGRFSLQSTMFGGLQQEHRSSPVNACEQLSALLSRNNLEVVPIQVLKTIEELVFRAGEASTSDEPVPNEF